MDVRLREVLPILKRLSTTLIEYVDNPWLKLLLLIVGTISMIALAVVIDVFVLDLLLPPESFGC
jgi:hypothetical protein